MVSGIQVRCVALWPITRQNGFEVSLLFNHSSDTSSTTYLGGKFTVSDSTDNTDSPTLTYSYVSGPCAFVSGATFSSSGAGACVVQANGAATANFNAASQTQNVSIAKATATVTLGSLAQTYDGTPKSATATTTPNGQTVDFT